MSSNRINIEALAEVLDGLIASGQFNTVESIRVMMRVEEHPINKAMWVGYTFGKWIGNGKMPYELFHTLLKTIGDFEVPPMPAFLRDRVKDMIKAMPDDVFLQAKEEFGDAMPDDVKRIFDERLQQMESAAPNKE